MIVSAFVVRSTTCPSSKKPRAGIPILKVDAGISSSPARVGKRSLRRIGKAPELLSVARSPPPRTGGAWGRSSSSVQKPVNCGASLKLRSETPTWV